MDGRKSLRKASEKPQKSLTDGERAKGKQSPSNGKRGIGLKTKLNRLLDSAVKEDDTARLHDLYNRILEGEFGDQAQLQLFFRWYDRLGALEDKVAYREFEKELETEALHEKHRLDKLKAEHAADIQENVTIGTTVFKKAVEHWDEGRIQQEYDSMMERN